MSEYYQELAVYQRDGFKVIVDKTYDDMDPWDVLSECYDDKNELYDDINKGNLEWFMLRVRVMIDEHEIAQNTVGCLLYEDANEVLNDGLAEEIISDTLDDAREILPSIVDKFLKVLDNKSPF